jgi:hypothetical protein
MKRHSGKESYAGTYVSLTACARGLLGGSLECDQYRSKKARAATMQYGASSVW